MFFYLDASAWVKRYLQEIGSASVHALFNGGERLASSTLGHLEVVAALVRRLPPPDWRVLERRLEPDWQDIAHLPLTNDVIHRAVDLAKQYKLRAADALHLATALEFQKHVLSINEALVLVASDDELLAAAQATGLAVQNPLSSAAKP